MAQQRNGTFSLAALGNGKAEIECIEVIGALGGIDNPAELESALGQLAAYAESIGEHEVTEALGAIEGIRAGLMHPMVKNVTVATQSRSYAQMERMRAIVTAGTKLQSEDAQRPNVFIFGRFNHIAANFLEIVDLKPSLPAQATLANANGPLHFIQARTFLRSGNIADAELDVLVARVGNAQYSAPAGQPIPAGLPIEYWSTQSYNSGLKSPKIRGLEQADSNTVITLRSTSTAPINYGFVIEFVMESYLGGDCGRIMPTLLRGPMRITPRTGNLLRR